MEDKVRRPPINLKELRPKGNEAKPGPLGYTEPDRKEGEMNNRGGSGGSGISAAIIAALIAVVASFILVIAIHPWGADMTRLNDNQKDIDTRLASVASSIGDVSSKLSNVINAQGTYLKQGDLAVLSTGLSQVQSSLTSVQALPGKLSDLQVQISSSDAAITKKIDADALLIGALQRQAVIDEAAIKAMQDSITALQKPAAAGSSKNITVKVKQMSSTLYPSSAGTELAGGFKVTLTNNTAAEVTDVILDVTVATDDFRGTDVTYTNSTLTGGGVIWQGQGQPWNGREFMNATWGLDLAAAATKTMYLNFTVKGTGFLEYEDSGVSFDVSADVL